MARELTEKERKEKEARKRRWISFWSQCPKINQAKPEDMEADEIREEIKKLGFNEEYQKELEAYDSELLTIYIKEEKAHFFDFLKAESKTEWKVLGYWKGSEEKNVQIDVEFLDNKKECVGNRLIHLIDAYNDNFVEEDLLYARTVPIEEGTLYPERRTEEHLK